MLLSDKKWEAAEVVVHICFSLHHGGRSVLLI